MQACPSQKRVGWCQTVPEQDGWLEVDGSWELKKEPPMSCATDVGYPLARSSPGRAICPAQQVKGHDSPLPVLKP